MASKKEQTKVAVSATLDTGTKVTATQEVIDKVSRQAQRTASASKSRTSK